LHPVQTTAFLPKINEERCTQCGLCVRACPIGAIETIESQDEWRNRHKEIKINEEICLGCGVCARACFKQSIKLQRRQEKIITPVNSVHRVVQMAIEKGQLQELIFDNKALGSHRAMAAILGAILKLSPVKQAMASKQMKSIFLDKLISKTIK
ncbi:MAG TPA: 4Fe-4S binding protein, partial [Patescibacteria group bacterium]|nr:4Fe-4S binding protein [Patescibacteria group bacterium]